MRTPQWKWEWNLNTVVILLGFVAGVAAWGATWERMSAGQRYNTERIDRLTERVAAIETTARMLDNHELRISNVEKQASDAAMAMRAVEGTLSSLAADMRVTREILQRLEASQRSRGPPP
ncbi:hypothetical protein LC049_21815 [Nitratireductor aquimarinus]|uniref:hypothetical protein n=1 Tax=Nitratireductor TaxID=245876 RepID=UPI001CD62FD8|nr:MULTISPECIES: hypothetical protein [Nitratireductor]MCA1305135.1 hypothetical protein [Nitratireductor aquimarinus]MDJ1466151.1 hypothetical protein [Nitratireductor sp. GZWM139]